MEQDADAPLKRDTCVSFACIPLLVLSLKTLNYFFRRMFRKKAMISKIIGMII
jgi:hypothetical protein